MLKTSSYHIARVKYLGIVIRYAFILFLLNVGYANAVPKSADDTPIVLTISGNSSFCYSTNFTTSYTVTNLSTGVFTWTVPSNCTIMSGQGSNTVSVRFNSASMGMNISVTNGGNGGSISVAAYTQPSGTSIVGPSSVCAGQTGVVFSVTGGPSTGFSWNASGAGITFPSGNSGQPISVNFASNFTGGTIGVSVINGPCLASVGPQTVSVSAIPATPGTITGTPQITPGDKGVSYSVGSVTNATSYNWTMPTGATLASGTGTNSILIDFATTFTGGNISVNGVGACTGPSSPLYNVALAGYPTALGSITTNAAPCAIPAGTTLTYSVPTNATATAYNWVVTGGDAAITSTTVANGFSSANVFYPGDIQSTTVTISVNGVNVKGSGPSSTLVVNVYKPVPAPGILHGPPSVCPNQNGVAFSVDAIPFAYSYQWTPSTGASIVSGQGTNSATFNFSSTYTGGTLSVAALSGPCTGASTLYSIPVTPSLPAAAGPISGNLIVCRNMTGVTYSVPPIDNAISYSWTLPTGATITSGQNTNSITVDYSSTAVGGTISVSGVNCLGNGTASTQTIVMNTAPGAAGSIFGTATPCQGGTLVNYAIVQIPNATGYNWNLPSGGTIVSGTNTSAITASFSLSAVAGNVTVQGTNCQGSGASSVLPITYATSGLGTVASGKAEPYVDLATGIMHTSIPLFNISDGEIQVPGSLNYSAVGVRVTDDDGWVGHNWNISGQDYQISREVRGLPDDYSASSPDNRKGWLVNSTVATSVKNLSLPPATSCGEEIANYNTLTAFDYNQDTEPDVYYVNAPGLSFQFYFDENKIPRALPYQDVIITPNTTTGPISSFTVTDEKGIIYTFSEVETITQSLQAANNFYLVRQTNLYKASISYAIGWRLSSISSPVYGTVSFTYRTVSVNDPNLIPKAYRYEYMYNYPIQLTNVSGAVAASTTLSYTRQSTIKILQKISAPNIEAVFSSAPRYVGAYLERLNAIQVFDKRDGASKLVRTILFSYTLSGTSQRAFLTAVSLSAGCMSANYAMEYYPGQLPSFSDVYNKDDWDFYRQGSLGAYIPYAESALIGTLKKITYPLKGYDVFFYEPHQYLSNGVNVPGGGIRLKKMISYDGVSSSDDRIKEYQYVGTDGKSSGKIQYKAQHNFSVVRLEKGTSSGSGVVDARYRAYVASYPTTVNAMFTMQSTTDLAHNSPLNGSVVAYGRVTVSVRDAGSSVYEFDLPASFGDVSANGNEWQASTVSIARPGVSGGGCDELGNIQTGANQYPYPPNPNYQFAQALLTKSTDFREDGVVVRDVLYTYQRVYGNGSSIRKLYGLALEEVPTYYYNGSTYQDAKMFLYSQYQIFTDVKTELNTKTETVYNSTDLSKKTAITTNYFFDSPNHRELARTETVSSDGSTIRNRIKYCKDYTITSASGAPAIALSALNANTLHKNLPVESVTSRIVSGTEKTISAGLTQYQTIGGKIYPATQYSFTSVDGSTSFVPSSINSGSTFQFDQTNYVLQKTFSAFDNFGNATEIVGRDRVTNAVAYGYNGTLPVVNVANAGIGEVRFSDFETSTPADFLITWSSPSYSTGRNNSKGLNVPAGGEFSNNFFASLAYKQAPYYILSCWIKASTAGSLSVLVSGPATVTTTCPFNVSSDYKYYRFRIPVRSVIGNVSSFITKIWSSVSTQIDDIAFYPEYSDFTATTYVIPNGKSSSTDSRGISTFFDYDVWNRPIAVYDQDRNVVKKYDYKVRP